MASQHEHEGVAPLSQIDSEIEKDVERGNCNRKEEEEIEEETASNKEVRIARERKQLSVPLRNTRSPSSARSTKSYRSHTDGYSHFHDPNSEEKQNDGIGDSQNLDKEFEVTFDGDADPHNPKNRPYLRKWLIVLIVSSSSLCVTCASALASSPDLSFG